MKNNIFIFILLMLLGGCSSLETISSKEAKELVISEYFPPVGLERSYIQYGTTGENLVASDRVKVELDSSGKEQIYIHETGGLTVERVHQYEVNDDEIRLVYVINAFKNEEVNQLELTNEKKWNTGDEDNSVSYLTGKGLDIQVPAGIFHDCIEVTNSVKTKKGDHKTVLYYAPHVGLIKTVVFLENDQEFVLSELTASNSDIVSPERNSQTDIEKGDSSEPASDFEKRDFSTYHNEEFDFAIDYPSEWDNQIEVSYGSWASDSEATVDFAYSVNGINQNVFSVVIFDYAVEEEQWENPMMRYLATHNGKTYGLSVSVEPTVELLDPKNEDKLEYVQKMIEDLDYVFETFRFQ